MVRNVSRKLCNAARRDRRAGPNLEAKRQSELAKRGVIERKGGGEETKKLRERYEKELLTDATASRLYEQYRDAGATWGACVQAAKTDWVSSFHVKWAPMLKSVRSSEQKKHKDYSNEK